MRNCGVTKNVVYRYTVYHTEKNNHFDQNIGTIGHKRSMLVNDNIAKVMHNIENNERLPDNILKNFERVNWTHSYNTRHSNKGKLCITKN